MDRVGGYFAYLSLYEDARAYEDVLIAMRAEAQAQRQAARQRELESRRRR